MSSGQSTFKTAMQSYYFFLLILLACAVDVSTSLFIQVVGLMCLKHRTARHLDKYA